MPGSYNEYKERLVDFVQNITQDTLAEAVVVAMTHWNFESSRESVDAIRRPAQGPVGLAQDVEIAPVVEVGQPLRVLQTQQDLDLAELRRLAAVRPL